MNIKVVENGIMVSQATVSGYIFCKWGGVCDLSYPTSKTRRGRCDAEGDICPTITSQAMMLCRVEKK